MIDDDIGVAFVGCGMVSDLHHSAILDTPGLRLVGVHDIHEAPMRARAAAWGVRAYATLGELLGDEAVAAVYVLTPSASHVAISVRCLDAGRHVLVEKPVSQDPHEFETLQRASEAAGRVVMPAHNYAYAPEFQRIVRLIRRGQLGTLRGVWVHYVLRHPEHIAAAYGGVLGEVMIHHTYLALALRGLPERLHAGIHAGAWERLEQEDQAWMVWEYEDGATASLFATFAADDESNDPWTFQVKVLGTEGSASFSWRDAVTRNRATPWFAFGMPIYEESYSHEAQAFRSAIAHGTEPISPLRDAAACCRLIGAAYEAARRHEVMDRSSFSKGSDPARSLA
ncbi:MAG: Gfo/Idh/MocA family protein [Candidatus Dormibacteraceae bacterium]